MHLRMSDKTHFATHSCASLKAFNHLGFEGHWARGGTTPISLDEGCDERSSAASPLVSSVAMRKFWEEDIDGGGAVDRALLHCMQRAFPGSMQRAAPLPQQVCALYSADNTRSDSGRSGRRSSSFSCILCTASSALCASDRGSRMTRHISQPCMLSIFACLP